MFDWTIKTIACVWLAACCCASLPAAEPFPAEKNSLGMTLIQLPAGEFERGMQDDQKLRENHRNTIEMGADFSDERPAHPVRITRPFWIGAHEVTALQFRKFTEATGYKTTAEATGRGALAFNPPDTDKLERFILSPKCTWREPGFEQTDDHPVVCVSWQDANAFCQWLSKQEGIAYRLPTEAEWEYAARAGGDTIYVGGDSPGTIYAFGNIGDAALETAFPGTVKRQQSAYLKPGDGDGVVFTAPVGQFKPNAWGLFDMHGNAWEWCSDRYWDRYYQELVKIARGGRPGGKMEPTIDPVGPEPTPQHKYGDWRSMRGGSWYTGPMASRGASRAYGEAGDAFCYAGFRVVKEVKK